MKSKLETIFLCGNCGNEFGKWVGQCPMCKEWNSLKEVKSLKSKSLKVGKAEKNEIKKLSNIGVKNVDNNQVFSSTISEFDRVLGKGIVRGSVVLFAGEPGIGKSTLLTQLVGKNGGLYVAGEESAEQIALRVDRLGLLAERFDVLETNSIEEIGEALERANNVYKIVVVDSIQTMVSYADGSGSLNRGGIGGVNQIRECTFQLIQMAKKNGVAMFIVGHVTKEGDIAGPKLLEHMVDTVLYFEGEKNGDLRILRVSKNRFGPTDEVGVFKMEEKGLREIKSEEINLMGGNADEQSPGKAITIVMEGTRPMMVEIQSLVTESFAPMPTRVFSGIDYNRGKLLVAVVQKILGIPLYKYDVYISVTGGIKIEDTGADLAIVGAMYSSYKEKPLTSQSTSSPSFDKEGNNQINKTKGVVLVGEVSLLGEVKKVRGWEKREKEAKAMGREIVKVGNIRELKI